MARVERVATLEDYTRKVAQLPKAYICRACGAKHTISIFEQADFDEVGKRITMCGRCGQLTYWQRI